MKQKISKKLFKNNECGFTLTEMLVTIFILMILIFAVSGIYVYSIRAQRRTLELNLIAQDVQFVMGVLSRKIRASEIDYSYYEGTVSSPSNELALYDRENNEGVVYKKIGQEMGICSCDGHCTVTNCPVDEDFNFNSLTAERLKVTDLEFYINPSEEPFDKPDPIQPRVTISIKVEGAGTELIIQQTVPQRFFERR